MTTPRDWYTARAAMWLATRDADADRATTISRLRLLTFFAGVALVSLGASRGVWLVAAGVAAFAAFGVLVVVHARRLDRVARAERAHRVNLRGLARLDRNWSALPAAPPLDMPDHPYAIDLDIVGHASILQWLGPAATVGGQRLLQEWILAPADPRTIRERQEAVVELAPAAEWREQLLSAGAAVAHDDASLHALLTWAEDARPLFPTWVRALVLVVTAATIGLLLAWAVGWVDEALWVLPLTVGLVLSFASQKRIHRVFDCVSSGGQTLDEYAVMLALGVNRDWRAAALQSVSAALRQGGDAPRVLRQLARLVDCSEARHAPLMHFPLQLLTLWDFHVLFAIERWRARCGRHLRGWLEALATVDALGVFAAIRHDEPEWCMPDVDPAADTMTARILAHPLISADRRVANDVVVGPPGGLLLVTGSNMSGKSTLLRAIGANAVLAQAGAPVCAAVLALPPVRVFTSIRVQDSLERGQSYFMAALARLKIIVDAAADAQRHGAPILYLLDEVLQGTNSAERAIAVQAIARHLLDAGAIGVMTTHDLSIATEPPFTTAAHLVHFSEQVHPDGRMTFDYTLREGLATSRNALRLMQLIGIEPR
jgi:predicted ATPase